MKKVLNSLLFLMMTIACFAQTTVVDIIVNSPNHNTLEAAVIAAELADDLSGEGSFTVFAPTDAAFEALPEGTVEMLLDDPTGMLADILLYHVIGAEVLSTDLTDGQMAMTLNGQDVTVTINDDGIFINDAQVTVADIPADNGVVHVIDAVLLPTPPPAPMTVVDIIVNSDVHNTLEAAVIAAELADDLSGEGPFTVFAPTDAAFEALPEGTVEMLLDDPTGMLADILLYHVIGAEVLSTDLTDGQMAMTLNGQDVTVTINDDGIFINDAQVTVADIPADNGVVHVIDAVLLPTPPPAPMTVVDIIVNSDVHNTLEAAVIAAELADDLSGEGPFTVFAPTDAAFEALPEGTVEMLLDDPTGMLADILLYHVIGAEVLSTDLTDGQMAMTLNGQEVMVTINDDGIFINDAQVIVADILADNGVVHVIDAVLTPDLTPPTGTAMVQIIHNAEFETVSVFANGEEIIPFLAYKTATSYIEVPADVELDLELRSKRNFEPADPVFATVMFESDKTYIVGVHGTFDDNDEIPVELAVFDEASSSADAGEVGVQFFHGSYDAPTVDIVTGGNPIFDDVSYGEFGEEMLFIPAENGYIIDVTTADNSTTVASYKLDIDFWKGNTLTVFATGSLNDGTFAPWVALSNGGTYPLPVSNGFNDDNEVFARNFTVNNDVNTNDISVYPNPFLDQTTIQYQTNITGDVFFSVYDTNGQLIRQIENRQQDAGRYFIKLDMTAFPSGTYYLQSYMNNVFETQPIIKID